MRAGAKLSFGILCALPFVAIASAAARPLHELLGHDAIGAMLFAVALASAWRLSGSVVARGRSHSFVALNHLAAAIIAFRNLRADINIIHA